MTSSNKATGVAQGAPSGLHGLSASNSEPNEAAGSIGENIRQEDKIEIEKLVDTKKQSKKRKWKKPKDMPKRPLSAYNLFFAHERKEMIKKGSLQKPSSEGDLVDGSAAPRKRKMGFAGLARSVAAKWKELAPDLRAPYEEQAAKEQARYKKEMEEWKRTQEERKTLDQQVQYAATTGIQPSSAAALAHFQGITGLSSALHPMMSIRDLAGARNSLSGNSAVSASSSSSAAGTTMWPAMPQTIANLGSIYDDSMELSSSSTTTATTFDPNSSMSSQIGGGAVGGAAGTFQTNSSSSLRTPQHYDSPIEQLMTPPEAQRQLLRNANLDMAVLPLLGSAHHQQQQLQQRRLREQQQQQLRLHQMIGRTNPHGLNVASPDRINSLASQLDDETFAFLSSLGQNNTNSDNSNKGPGQGRSNF